MADFLPTAHRIDDPGWLPLFGNWSACGDHRTASRTADVEPCIQSDRRDGADCQREGLPPRQWPRQLENTELYSIAQTYQTMVQRLNHINLRKEQEDLAAYLISREKTAKLPEWVEETYAKPGVRDSCRGHAPQ